LIIQHQVKGDAEQNSPLRFTG